MENIHAQLAERIRDAAVNETPLEILGGGSKAFYGQPVSGDTLDVMPYRGIVEYEPSELVISVRAGTPLREVEAALAERGQMLPFEPPYFAEAATIGGCVAAGLSGPARAYRGSVRDFVLGVRIIDGLGRDLRFGGKVIKNVAGYDTSRLMTGALGTLGVITEIAFKILPLPVTEETPTIRHVPRQSDRANESLGGTTAAVVGYLPCRRSALGAALRHIERGGGSEEKTWRRSANESERVLARCARASK